MSERKGPLRVAYFAHDTRTYGGSAMSLLNMISSLGDAIVPVVICREEGHIVDLLRQRGVDCIVYAYEMPVCDDSGLKYFARLPKLLAWHTNKYIKDVKALGALLAARDIDIVHANNSLSIIARGVAKRIKAKFVCHVREYLSLDFNIKVVGGYGLLGYRINRADAVIAISSDIFRFWKMKGRNGQVIGNAVKRTAEAVYNPDKQKYVLFCSAFLSVRKGTFLAAEAFLRSGLHKRGYKLLMYGKCDLPTLDTLSELMAKYHGEGSIEAKGFAENLKDVYANAAAYIMASEQEALGRVTIEAMFYGCPVVGRASGGTTDIVKDGTTGYLFNDIDECAARLVEVVDKDQSRLIRQAQDYVKANYSEESYRKKILDLYHSLIEK